MRRTWIAAGALSLSLLIPQGRGWGLGVVIAQERADSPKKEAAASETKPTKGDKAARDKAAADKAAADKAAADNAAADKASKGESKASKSESKQPEKAALDTQSKRKATSNQSAGRAESPSSAAARRGELQQRAEPPAPGTALDPTLKPTGSRGAAAVAVPEPTGVSDPTLTPLPSVIPPLPAPEEAASDEALRERVQAALLKNPSLSYTARLVGVSVKDGEITLNGQLNTQYEKVNVERAVEKVRGEHVVHNQLKVRSPAAPTDPAAVTTRNVE